MRAGIDQLVHLLITELEVPTVHLLGQRRSPRAVTRVFVLVDAAGVVEHGKQVTDHRINEWPWPWIERNHPAALLHGLGQTEQPGVGPDSRPVPDTVVAPPVAAVLGMNGLEQVVGENGRLHRVPLVIEHACLRPHGEFPPSPAVALANPSRPPHP